MARSNRRSRCKYPGGVAALIKGSQGFHMQMHYLNATASDINAQVAITFHKAAPGTITQHAGVFFFNNASGIHVPPNTTTDIGASCTFAKNVSVLFGVEQMTKRFGAAYTDYRARVRRWIGVSRQR